MRGEMAPVPQRGRELGHSAPRRKGVGVGHFFVAVEMTAAHRRQHGSGFVF